MKELSKLFIPCSLVGCALGVQAQENRTPNIVLIVADDLGYGDLSCYGARRISTPGIDRLADEGLRFTQGYAAAATSTPAATPCSPVCIPGLIRMPRYYPATRR